MVTLYRSASYLRRRCSWTKAIVAKSVWVFLELEDRLHFLCYAKMMFAFLVALVLTPWTAALYLTLKIQRIAVTASIKLFYRRFTLIDTQSVRCALESDRNKGIVALLLSLSDVITLSELRQRVLRDIVEQKTEDGKATFPNLRKRVFKNRFGWYLSQPDDRFDIANHVIDAEVSWRGRPLTDANIQNYIGDVSSRLLPEAISPWQMVLINMLRNDVGGDVNFVLIRFHPIISEGLSLGRALTRTVQGSHDDAQPSASGSTQPQPEVEFTPSQTGSHGNHETPFLNRNFTMFCHNSATRALCRQTDEALASLWQELRRKWLHLLGNVATLRQAMLEYEKSCGESDRGDSWWCSSALRYAVFLRDRGHLSATAMVRRSVGVPWVFLRSGWTLGRLLLLEIRLVVSDGRPVYARVRDSAREVARTAAVVFAAPSIIYKELRPGKDQDKRFPWLRRSGSCRKAVSWSEPLPLELVRKVKEMTNARTVNDVLISVCAGCLTSYFKHTGIEAPDNVSATLPVYFKPFSQADEFGTDGFQTLSLPTGGDTDNLCRLDITKRRMQRNRESPTKYLISVFLLRYARNFAPDWLLAVVLRWLSRNYPVTLTNIVLPETSVEALGGHRKLKAMYYWRPPLANTALSLSLITYNGQVSLVAMSAQDIVSQPQIITEHFAKEFNGLACALGIRLQRQSLHHKETLMQPRLSQPLATDGDTDQN